jgi:DNA helicase-2/ATP-dependent DNA helicase PcrA
MLTPGQEGRARTQFTGDWTAERARLLAEESTISFDLFAHAAARLFEESARLRHWIADLFPLIILDEFQDTDDDQWRLARALAEASTVAFLADEEQRIYDFRTGVRADRLDILRNQVVLSETNLEEDNHRSRGSKIVAFANVVLRGTGPLPQTSDVIMRSYERYQNSFNSTVHFAVGNAFSTLRERGISKPTVAVLATSNDLVGDISDLLSNTHGFGPRTLQPIDHDVIWDAELSASAALAVASALEYISAPSLERRRSLLLYTADYWLVKQDWAVQHGGRGRDVAKRRADRFLAGAVRLEYNQALRLGVCQTLCETASQIGSLIGDPVADWRACRDIFRGHDDLKELFAQVRMVRLFRASDTLAAALIGLWTERGSYVGAASVTRRVLDQQRLMGGELEPRGCSLMTLHKSKGKEFDSVVIVEGFRGGALFRQDEAPYYAGSRRLLRVGITRARKLVVIVRPRGAMPLVD